MFLVVDGMITNVINAYEALAGKTEKYFTDLYVKRKLFKFICVEKKNQLDATEWFIALIICSKCFGHFFAHHQELEAMCVLLPSMVCDALVAGCWRSGAEQQAMRSG